MKDNQDASLSTVRDAHDLGINAIEFSPNHCLITSKHTERPLSLFYSVHTAHTALKCLPFNIYNNINLLFILTDDEGVTEYEYTMYSCGNDHCIVVWSIYFIVQAKATGGKMCLTKVKLRLNGHSSAISQIRVSASGNVLASTSIDKTTRLWDVRDYMFCLV